MRCGCLEDALVYLDDQIRRHPKSSDLYGLSGRIAQKLGLHDLARTRFAFASTLAPQPGYYQIQLGIEYLRLGRSLDARTALETALESIPDHPVCRYNLAIIARADGDYDRVDNLLEPLLVGTDTYARAFLLAAACAYENKQYEQAIQWAEERLRLAADDSTAHEVLARALNATGRTEEAVSHMRMAIAIQEQSGRLHRKLGQMLMTTHPYEARRHLRDSLIVSDPDLRAHKDLAILHAQHGEMERAWSEFNMVVEHAPKSDHKGLQAHLEKIEHERMNDVQE